MTTRLAMVLLSESDAFADAIIAQGQQLRPEFELTELRFVAAIDSDVHSVVEVGFGFTLTHGSGDDEDDAADIYAVLRAFYEHPAPPQEADRKALLPRAVADAWPVFRGHLDRVLAEMGFPPFHGVRHLPSTLEVLAAHVFADTLELDRRIAASAAQTTEEA